MNNDSEKVTEFSSIDNQDGFIKTQLKRLWLTFAPVSYLKHLNKKNYGIELDIKHPETFREKINWLKVYYNDPLVSICLDKYRVRTYIESLGLGHILNECYGVYPNFSWVMFDELPESFSFTATHGRNWRINCKNIEELDFDATRKYFSKLLRKRYHIAEGAKAYYFIKPRIMAEKFLDIPYDKYFTSYSVMCFNGKPEYFLFVGNFKGRKTYNVYNLDMTPANFSFCNSSNEPSKILNVPFHLNSMIEYSERISKPFPYARVSFFVNNEELIFDSIDFFDDIVLGNIYPVIFNKLLGEKIVLPKRRRFGDLLAKKHDNSVDNTKNDVFINDTEEFSDIYQDEIVYDDLYSESEIYKEAPKEDFIDEFNDEDFDEAYDEIEDVENNVVEEPENVIVDPDKFNDYVVVEEPENISESVDTSDFELVKREVDEEAAIDDSKEKSRPFIEKIKIICASVLSIVKTFFIKSKDTVASWNIGGKLKIAAVRLWKWIKKSAVVCSDAVVRFAKASWTFICKYADVIKNLTVKYSKIAGKAIAKYAKIVWSFIVRYSKVAWEYAVKMYRRVKDKIKKFINSIKNKEK